MEIKWTVPAPLEGEPEFDGYCLIDMPGYVDRVKLIKELNFKVDNDGNVEGDIMSQMDVMEKLFDVAKKYVKEVAVKHLKSGAELKTVDELGFYANTQKVLIQVGGLILSGPQLGEG